MKKHGIKRRVLAALMTACMVVGAVPGVSLADVLMYYNDVMLCYGITEDELKQAYIEKFQKNMKRW